MPTPAGHSSARSTDSVALGRSLAKPSGRRLDPNRNSATALHFTVEEPTEEPSLVVGYSTRSLAGVGPGRTFDLPAEIRCNKHLRCRVYRTALLRGLHATVRTNVQRHAHMLSVGNRWL